LTFERGSDEGGWFQTAGAGKRPTRAIRKRKKKDSSGVGRRNS